MQRPSKNCARCTRYANSSGISAYSRRYFTFDTLRDTMLHMKKGKIQRIGKRERKYVEEVLATDFANSKSCGILERFERAFAKKFHVKYALAHTNGTST